MSSPLSGQPQTDIISLEGTKNTQRYSRQLRSPALTAAIKKYDLAVKNYAETFNPKTVPEFAVSLEALQAKDDEDIFWDDMVFDIKEADWSRNQDCRQGEGFCVRWFSQILLTDGRYQIYAHAGSGGGGKGSSTSRNCETYTLVPQSAQQY